MIRRAWLKFFFLLLLSGGGNFTWAKPPNILFLLADDMRPDCISALGNTQIQTPNLDKLVERGLTFTRANCSYPICVVSRAEMLTGRHGWEIGVDRHGRVAGDAEAVDWAEALRRGGYQTRHVGKWHVSGRPSQRGYDKVAGLFGSGGGKYWKEGQTDWKGFPITGYRGWVFQNDDRSELYPELGVGITPDISATFADAAISLIEADKNGDSPWFCHVNFTAPHDPLLFPPGTDPNAPRELPPLPENYQPVHTFDHGNFDGRDEALLPWPRTPHAVQDLLRVYYQVIEDMDAQIGRILEALETSGQLEETLIIFSSDHGMACGSHGLRGKQNQYDHTFHVPLLFAGPGIPKSASSDAQVYLRELYPTTCDLAGVATPPSVTAESFAHVLANPDTEHHEDVFGYFKDTQRMIRTKDNWKLIHYPAIDRWQLFDLNADSSEVENLSSSSRAEVQSRKERLIRKLRAWREHLNDPTL